LLVASLLTNTPNYSNATPTTTYTVCSKAAHRVAVLAAETLGMDVDAESPRLFCSLIPPNEMKVAALR